MNTRNNLKLRQDVSFRRAALLFVALCAILVTSCATKQDVVYFQNTGDFETLVDKNSITPKFKVDDVLSIYVSTLDNEASAPFNLFRGGSEGGLRPEQVDYLIDKDGEIDFPVIGSFFGRIEGYAS